MEPERPGMEGPVKPIKAYEKMEDSRQKLAGETAKRSIETVVEKATGVADKGSELSNPPQQANQQRKVPEAAMGEQGELPGLQSGSVSLCGNALTDKVEALSGVYHD